MSGIMAEVLTQEMKDWFGDGEYDVDLMLTMGVVSPEQIICMWHGDPESPGFTGPKQMKFDMQKAGQP